MAVKIGALLLVPSFESISKVGFILVLVFMNVESPIRMHGVKYLTGPCQRHMIRPTQLYQCSPKLVSSRCLLGSPPDARINTINVLVVSNQNISAYNWSLH
jgi:hypothetical protein